MRIKIYNNIMEIKTSDNFCIITPFSPKLDKKEATKLFAEIIRNKNLKMGIDMSFVEECTIEFIELISQIGNIGIFNVTSDVFVLFNVMNVDKKINLFVNEIDFKADKHQLLNRKFCLI